MDKEVNPNDFNNINVIDNIFQLHGTRFSSLYVPDPNENVGHIWIKAADVARFFGYKNVDAAVKKYVPAKNKKKYAEIVEVAEKYYLVSKVTLETIFMDVTGFCVFVGLSNLPVPKSVHKWMYWKITLGAMMGHL